MWELSIELENCTSSFYFKQYKELMDFIQRHQKASNCTNYKYTLWFEEN